MPFSPDALLERNKRYRVLLGWADCVITQQTQEIERLSCRVAALETLNKGQQLRIIALMPKKPRRDARGRFT